MMTETRQATVLIIDDDKGALETFGRMLGLEGYRVVTADNAEDGLRLALGCHPDAILLDLRMPGMDGLECLRRLRSHADLRASRIGIITGDYSLADSIAGELQTLRVEEFRLKPLWINDLVGLVHKLIAGSEQAPRQG